MPDRIRFLEPSQVRVVDRPGSIGLRVEIEGEQTILNAQIRRAFPLSHANELISIRDGKGTEIGILRTVEGLDNDTRNSFENELDRRYFTPQITAIEELKQDAGMWRFSVQTQRGPSEFYVRNWRDSAHELTPNRWHINTVDGGRYEIIDVEALDPLSRKLMDQVL